MRDAWNRGDYSHGAGADGDGDGDADAEEIVDGSSDGDSGDSSDSDASSSRSEGEKHNVFDAGDEVRRRRGRWQLRKRRTGIKKIRRRRHCRPNNKTLSTFLASPL